ncbi:MAG: alcohol dehydrogenase catalytic domain-containing protein [Acidimicrobiales bacterium]
MTANSMQALVYTGAGELEVQTLAAPEPGPGEARIEIARCGICGTDLHMVLDGYARPGSVLGHEWSGRIIALADDVHGWAIGDRVVAAPPPACGECRSCRRGRPAVCRQRGATDYLSFRGAFAEYVIADAAHLRRIPEAVSDRAAALTEPLAVVLHALSLAEAESDDRVLVTGAGPLGLLVIAALRARGVTDITVSEPMPLRRDHAGKVGARRLIGPSDLPDPPMGEPVADPFDIVFECSGRADAAASALGQLDRAGTLVLLGTGSVSPQFNHNRMIVLELVVVGSFNYDHDGFDDALEMLASGVLPIDDIIDPVEVGLLGVAAAIRESAEGLRRGKVLVDPCSRNEDTNP